MVGKSRKDLETPFERELLTPVIRTSMLGKAAMTVAEAEVVQADMTIEQLDEVIVEDDKRLKDLQTLQGARYRAKARLEALRDGTFNEWND